MHGRGTRARRPRALAVVSPALEVGGLASRALPLCSNSAAAKGKRHARVEGGCLSRPPRRRSNALAGKVHTAPSPPQRRRRNKGSAPSLTQRLHRNKGRAPAALYLWQRLCWSNEGAPTTGRTSCVLPVASLPPEREESAVAPSPLQRRRRREGRARAAPSSLQRRRENSTSPARPPRCSAGAAVQGGRTIAPVMPPPGWAPPP